MVNQKDSSLGTAEQRLKAGRSLRDQLIGAWKLVSYVEEPVDGSAPSYPFGEDAQGIIIYTPDGFMSAQLCRRERASFASNDWYKGAPEEFAAAASSYFAYTGPFPRGRREADPDAYDVHITVSELDRSNATARDSNRGRFSPHYHRELSRVGRQARKSVSALETRNRSLRRR